MNLTSTLESTWADIFASVQERKTGNVSLMALQLRKAIMKDHPNLGFSFNGRHLQSDPTKPNFVIWEKDKNQQVLFFGTLIFESEKRSSQTQIVRHFLSVIECNNFDVLVKNSADTEFQYETFPLSPCFEFGLFFISASGQSGYNFRSLWKSMTPDQLSRFHVAQIETESIGQKIKPLYRSPPENQEMRRVILNPELEF
jgi:hypothetical protein